MFRDIPARFGMNLDRPINGIGGVLLVWCAVMAVAAVLIYLSAICWMVFAKLFRSRREVESIAFSGVHTRFDAWLVNLLFSKE